MGQSEVKSGALIMKKTMVILAMALTVLIGSSAWGFPPIGSEYEVYYEDGGSADTIVFYAYFEPAQWMNSPWGSSYKWLAMKKEMIIFANDDSVFPPVLEQKKNISCVKNETEMYVKCTASGGNYFDGENGVWTQYKDAVVRLRFELKKYDGTSAIYKTPLIPMPDVVSVNFDEDDSGDDAAGSGTDDDSGSSGSDGQVPDGADSDGDKIVDSKDNCPNQYNPNQKDNDGDGFGDWCDNCMFVANADQADSDGDGFGDACVLDSDGDGVPDKNDNCPSVANADQANADHDFYGDACDSPQTTQQSVSGDETSDLLKGYGYDEGCTLVPAGQAGSGAMATVMFILASLTAIWARKRR